MMAFSPRRTRALTGSSAATMVLDLASRATIDPHEASTVLDLAIVSVEQVTVYRREYQLAANMLWTDATAIVGGVADTWRVLDLVPRELSIVALRLDPPYELRPHIKHTNDGPLLVGLDHCHRVRAGHLVIRTAPQAARIERITLSTDYSPTTT
jgi:hypothetical protein